MRAFKKVKWLLKPFLPLAFVTSLKLRQARWKIYTLSSSNYFLSNQGAEVVKFSMISWKRFTPAFDTHAKNIKLSNRKPSMHEQGIELKWQSAADWGYLTTLSCLSRNFSKWLLSCFRLVHASDPMGSDSSSILWAKSCNYLQGCTRTTVQVLLKVKQTAKKIQCPN